MSKQEQQETAEATPCSVIKLDNVSISHSNGPLLTHINLTIDKGEFVYLIGKSGSGKTSLLRTLYADRQLECGTATVCGFDLAHLKRRHIPKLRRQIGIVFQTPRLLTDRNVYDNLFFVLRATGWKKRKEIDDRIMQSLEAVGLADKATAMPQRLSEGEQQRIGIARAVVNKPALIVADEPTGNLDPITSSEIIALLQKINVETKATMLISTHDFMMIDKYPARLLCCENGSIIAPQ